MNYFTLLFLPLLTLFNASSALASGGEHSSPLQRVNVLLQRGETTQAYNLLGKLEQGYGSNPDYNYLLGLASMQTGHYSQARNAFERSILLDPANAGAHLDLAITLIKLELYAEASRTLDKVETVFSPPTSIQKVINHYRNKIPEQRKSTSVVAGNVFSAIGHSSNVNNGTDKSLIKLDLGDGPVSLPLNDNSRSSPDSYMEAGATLNYAISQQRWRTQLISAVQKRDYNTLSEFDTTNIFMGGNIQRKFSAYELEAGIYYSQVWLDSKDYQSSIISNLLYRHQFSSGLRLAAQLRSDQASYVQTPVNDMNTYGIEVTASYPFRLLDTQNLIQGQLKVSDGQAQDNRAGGDQTRWRSSITLLNQPTAKQIFRITAFMARDADDSPYNKGLFGDTVREIAKQGLEISYSYYLSPEWSVSVSASTAKNSSNLELFTTDTEEISLRLLYQF